MFYTNTRSPVKVVGGCCGTDARHIDEMCRAWVAAGDA
jgi:methionine synthase I (cobalamin-dependent)